ncbi:MAG: hypothetical protein AAB617_03075 [Patescibacteria group bacterium]
MGIESFKQPTTPESEGVPPEEASKGIEGNSAEEAVAKKEISPTQKVIEKTEQSIRILSTLWDKRFEVLNQYYKERNKKRFSVKSDESISSEIKDILSQLAPINAREEKVVEILEQGAASGAEILQNVPESTEETLEAREAVSEFNEKTALASKIIERYSELISSHEDILKIEKELIESPDESKMELYLKRMGMFSAEFKVMDKGEIEGLKKYFSDIESDLQKVEEARKQGKPLEHLKQSVVSAVVRVAVANMIAGLVIGNPFENPYFWQLTAATVPSVLAVNYVDYYFKIFTKITQRLNKLGS